MPRRLRLGAQDRATVKMLVFAGAGLALVAGGVATGSSRAAGGSVLLKNANGQSDQYTGVARFHGDSTCTGVLLRTVSGAALRKAPAYVLTNGHCRTLLDANTVELNAPQKGERVVFNFFADTKGGQVPIAVRRMTYATMKKTDLAIAELGVTLGVLASRNVRAVPLATVLPVHGGA